MKKIILSFLLLLSTIGAIAQESRFTFGVSAGANYSFSSLGKIQGDNADDKGLPGFQAGLNVEYRLNRTFYLQSGLYFITKRMKFEYSLDALGVSGRYDYTTKINPGYLQIPLRIALKTQLGTNSQLYFRGGVYFAYGVSGKYKSTDNLFLEGETSSTATYKESHFIYGDDYLERYDWGLSLGAGIEIKRYVVGLDLDLGLKNILKENHYFWPLTHDSKYKNRTLSLTAGYRF